MELTCAKCCKKFEITISENKNQDYPSCPECGFGPENCNHPIEERESNWIKDVASGNRIEHLYCGKCGIPVNNF